MDERSFGARVGPMVALIVAGGAVLYGMDRYAKQELHEQELVVLEQSIRAADWGCMSNVRQTGQRGRDCDDVEQGCKRLMVEAPDKWAANWSCDR